MLYYILTFPDENKYSINYKKIKRVLKRLKIVLLKSIKLILNKDKKSVHKYEKKKKKIDN